MRLGPVKGHRGLNQKHEKEKTDLENEITSLQREC